jgi:hypothetical protein
MSNYQKIYKFDNGYGASVVSHLGSYGGKNGLFEVAVIGKDGDLDYTTPVTNNVIGWLDFTGVAEVLEQIKNLSSNTDMVNFSALGQDNDMRRNSA